MGNGRFPFNGEQLPNTLRALKLRGGVIAVAALDVLGQLLQHLAAFEPLLVFLWCVIAAVSVITSAVGERLAFALKAVLAVGTAELQGLVLSVPSQFIRFESRLELAIGFIFEPD